MLRTYRLNGSEREEATSIESVVCVCLLRISLRRQQHNWRTPSSPATPSSYDGTILMLSPVGDGLLVVFGLGQLHLFCVCVRQQADKVARGTWLTRVRLVRKCMRKVGVVGRYSKWYASDLMPRLGYLSKQMAWTPGSNPQTTYTHMSMCVFEYKYV